jgi:aryl-alcohol dehydrogenase-like predicted oxidoreductase
MLFGESTDAATAEQLLGSCLDAGVNFFDAAEMYPVPQRAETCGRSEEVLGAWLNRQRRYAAGKGRGRRHHYSIRLRCSGSACRGVGVRAAAYARK